MIAEILFYAIDMILLGFIAVLSCFLFLFGGAIAIILVMKIILGVEEYLGDKDEN